MAPGGEGRVGRRSALLAALGGPAGLGLLLLMAFLACGVWPGVLVANWASRDLAAALGDRPPVFALALSTDERRLIDRAAARVAPRRRPDRRRECVEARAAVALLDPQRVAVGSVSSCEVAVPSLAAAFEALREARGLAAAGDARAARTMARSAISSGSGIVTLAIDDRLTAALAGAGREDGTKARHASQFPRWSPAWPTTVGEWTLVEFDIDEAALVAGTAVEVVLRWRQTRSPGRQPSEAKVERDWWRKERSVNLVADGGFEWSSQGDPSPWQLADGSELALEPRGEGCSTVLKVGPPQREDGVIVPTSELPLGKNCGLLVGAWMRSDAGLPALSVVWTTFRERASLPSVNVVNGGDFSWRRVSQLFALVPAGAAGVRLYVSNWSRQGHTDGQVTNSSVAADNVFAVPVSLPGRPVCELITSLNVPGH